MASTTRFLQASKNSSTPYAPKSSRPAAAAARPNTLPCATAEMRGDRTVGVGEKRPVVAVKAVAVADHGINLVSLFANEIASGRAMKLLDRPVLKPNSWNVQQIQMVIEKAMIDCRFFTMFAVLGSLLGSVLCFIEGCVMIVRSYIHYFHGMVSPHQSDQGHVVHLLIEAIDMFLVGTALLVFGMGLYVTYVGTKSNNGNESLLPNSNLFGLFHLKTLPSWIQMQSVSQAKSKIGHAVMMILQVGVLEKFKSVPLVTGLDLACFAGALLFSSAGIFVLSRLSMDKTSC